METKKLCRVCKTELIKGQNVKRSDVKICNDCLVDEKLAREKKQQTSESIRCSKCSGNFPAEQYMKFLRQCERCREAASNNRKSKEKIQILMITKIPKKMFLAYR